MIQVFPVAQTVVNWDVFYKITQSALNRSLAAGLDSAKMPTRDINAFIACLGEMINDDQTPVETLCEAGALLRHVSVSFFVLAPQALIKELAIEGSVSIAENDNHKLLSIAVVSGNLEQWRTTIINGLSHHTTDDLRMFCSLILKQFDKMKLRRMFDGYSRSEDINGTLSLERQR